MDGRLITWGANSYGQLGRGFFSPHHGSTLSPTKIASELKAGGREGPRATAPAAARANDDDGGAQSTAAAQVEKHQAKVRFALYSGILFIAVFLSISSFLRMHLSSMHSNMCTLSLLMCSHICAHWLAYFFCLFSVFLCSRLWPHSRRSKQKKLESC